MVSDCVFCRIVSGQESALIIHENDYALALFPKEMNVKGHIIVIPKKHFKNIFSISNNDLAAVMSMAKNVARQLLQTINATGVNILHASGKNAQQSIDHFHIHLIPRFDGDEIDAWPNLPRYDGDRVELLKKIRHETTAEF